LYYGPQATVDDIAPNNSLASIEPSFSFARTGLPIGFQREMGVWVSAGRN